MRSAIPRWPVVFVLFAACARPAPMHPIPGFTPEDDVRAPPPGTIALPVGARVEVHVETTLSTRTSQPGDPFTATVIAPVVGLDGHTVIHEGSKLHGRVLSVETGEDGRPPSMKVVFDTVDTTMGRRKLRATLANAVNGTVAIRPSRARELSATAVGGGPATSEPEGENGAPTADDAERTDAAPEDEGTETVGIPEGTVLELVLVQPLRI